LLVDWELGSFGFGVEFEDGFVEFDEGVACGGEFDVAFFYLEEVVLDFGFFFVFF